MNLCAEKKAEDQVNNPIRRPMPFYGNSLNALIGELYSHVLIDGSRASPRAQQVIEAPAPVVIDILPDRYPWTFIPGRRLNPYFVVAEVLWILSGRNDVKFISYYNQQMAAYSNDGVTFHGAYGHRMRNYPAYTLALEEGKFDKDHIDQLELVVERLKSDSFSRQSLISFWDPSRDLRSGSKDYPCNNMCYFTLRNSELHMSVIRRSNDMIWGLPYNQVQFYFIHAIVAGSLNATIGSYVEFVQNMHVYTENYPKLYEHIVKKLDGGLNPYGLVKKVSGLKQQDRRITIREFESFANIFFSEEAEWRAMPNLMTLQRVKYAASKMLDTGVPKYWVDNMLMLPAAWNARKNGYPSLHDRLIENVEPGLAWLIKDFN